MPKLTLTDIESGYASTSELNANFEAIEEALENTLSRDGTSPNQMNANLDMNGFRIINELASTGEGFVWEGSWVTATSYAINNLVNINGNTYICVTTHTSTVFANDLADGKWELIAAKGADGGGSGDVIAANNLSEYTASASTARGNIGAAKSGANSDITSLSAISTPLSVTQGGTGEGTAEDAFNALKQAATESATGVVEKATAAELIDGTADKYPDCAVIKAEVENASYDNTTSGLTATTIKGAIDEIAAGVGGAWELISTTSITATSSIPLALNRATYAEWKFILDDVIPASDDEEILMQLGYGGTPTYDTSNASMASVSGATFTPYTVIGKDGVSSRVGTAAGESGHATIELGGMASTASCGFCFESKASWVSAGGSCLSEVIVGTYSGATKRDWTYVRFKPASGNFEANGTIKMYGLRRS